MESARVSRLTKVSISQHGVDKANQARLVMDRKKKELAMQVAQRLKKDNERRMEARGQ